MQKVQVPVHERAILIHKFAALDSILASLY
jgi:hypothetical protein